MFNLTRQGDTDQNNIMQFACDTVDDIETLAEQTKLMRLGIGSTAIVIEDSSVWMLGGDRKWHSLGAGDVVGGGSGTDTPVDSGLKVKIVDELPTSGISTKTIYFVPDSDPNATNAYDEYMYINGAWEAIGAANIDTSNFVTTSNVGEVIDSQFSHISNNDIDGLF